MIKKLLLVSIGCLSLVGGANAQQLIAGWDFQTTTTGGTAAAASPNTPILFNANVGTGTLYLDGTHGSSLWAAATELNSFGGTAINATNGLSTSTTGAATLALLGGTSNAANGKAIVFTLSMTGLSSLTLSYAAQGTASGFSTETWAYSTDATNWTTFYTVSSGTTAGTLTTSFANSGVLGSSVSASLDNASLVYIRMIGTGATNSSGNNRLDNIQFTAVPEPHEYALAVAGLLGVVVLMRHRKAAQVF